MQDTEADEQELLITRPDSRLDADRWARGSSRRRRVWTISTLVLLVLPFAFLLWMTSSSRTSGPTHSDSNSTSLSISAPAAFRLNPSFAVAVGLMMRNRMRLTVRITYLRLIHAGTLAPLRVSIDELALTLIEADGARLMHDAWAEKAKEEGKGDLEHEEGFWIKAQMVEDEFAYDDPNMHPKARAILRYTTSPTTPSLNAEPLPTTRPGPPPGPGSTQDEIDAWFALPQFDEWALGAPSFPVCFPSFV
ncbi:Ferroxidase/laccase group [Mycena venus]|uniref:Ferroxidase/laccase group n=1 Tax=Mycena venus TaxID=2733690 RepID=A0A8H7D589_9AGAR|nr:Ferroxidase/laccase group [Mycena venus]